MRWNWLCLISIGVAIRVAPACGASVTPDAGIVLSPLDGTMGCLTRVPGLEDQEFTLGIPETIACRKRMLVNWPDARIDWDPPGASGEVTASFTVEGILRYALKLVPATDHVDVEMTVQNLSAEIWHDVFAFNCVSPTGAESFKDFKLQRTWMSAHGRPRLLADTTRRRGGPMPTVAFYTHEQIPWHLESGFVRSFSATSPDRTDDSWIVTLSEPAGAYMAATSLDSLFLFDNLDRCCIHSAPSFGDIGPGESSTTVCRMYFAKGGLEDFLKRYEADRRALASRQKWARPKPPRIELRPMASKPEAPQRYVAFEIRPPWMKEGYAYLRLPETVWSSLGLHFIDHHRDDMPARAEVESWPTWQVDPATGELSMQAVTKDGIAFAARARPYADEVVLEFRIKNKTGAALDWVGMDPCLVLTHAPGFNKQHDLSQLYAWIGGEFKDWTGITPTPADKGRFPWPLMLTRETARQYQGPRDYPDGAWIVDQQADCGVIARRSEDGKHLIAVRWNSLDWLMSNTGIPCLHAGPAHSARLGPDEEHVWHGKLYLLENVPETLRMRYNGDSGELPQRP